MAWLVVSNMVYYLAGVLTAIFALLVLGSQRERKRDRRKWASVSSLKWNWDFDYSMPHEMTAQDVARMVALAAYSKVNAGRDGENMRKVEVAPGDYTIRMAMSASFVKREDNV